MAFEESVTTISLPAAGNLSADQFKFVEVDANGRAAVVATLGAHADGVLMNDPNAIDRAAAVAINGVVRVKCAAAVTRGGPVSSTAAGLATPALATHIILGTALETGATNSIIAVLFNPRGPA